MSGIPASGVGAPYVAGGKLATRRGTRKDSRLAEAIENQTLGRRCDPTASGRSDDRMHRALACGLAPKRGPSLNYSLAAN